MSNNGDSPWDKLQRGEEKAILHRLDERTERMDERIERMDRRVQEQDAILSEHDDRIQRNTTILNAITFGLGAAITSVMAKFGGFIKIF